MAALLPLHLHGCPDAPPPRPASSLRVGAHPRRGGIRGRRRNPPCAANSVHPSTNPTAHHHDPVLKVPGAAGDVGGGWGSNGGGGAKPDYAPPGQRRRAPRDLEEEAWDLLRESVVSYCGSPVGTIAACDPNDASPLNYDQVFIRDFVPSGIAFLLKGEYDIVRNFILHTLQLQVMPPIALNHRASYFVLIE